VKALRNLGVWALAIVGPVIACSGKHIETATAVDDASAGGDGDEASPEVALFEWTMVDDFEKTSLPKEVPPIDNPPFSGGWYIFDDGSLGSSTDPNPNPQKQVVRDTALDQPHDTVSVTSPSTHALHMYGGPYTGTFGSGVKALLMDGAPYDASGFKGIFFWAKKGSAAASSVVHVSFSTIDDTPGPLSKCHDPPTPGKADGCSDEFHAYITLHSDWLLYTIYFTDLAQGGFGYRPPDGFDSKNVIGINLLNKQGEPFDQWIDDLAFFK